MTIANWILSLTTVAEFVASPINLWTGRNNTIPSLSTETTHA
jgi:hypothetical protein